MASEPVHVHGVRVGRVEVSTAHVRDVGVSIAIAFHPEWPGMWEVMAREVGRK